MRTYLRSDYALHPCGAGYEYCDGGVFSLRSCSIDIHLKHYAAQI